MTNEERLKKMLEPYFKISNVTLRPPIPCPYLNFEALAEKAIVVEFEVTGYKPDYDRTILEGANGECLDLPGEVGECGDLFTAIIIAEEE